MTSALGNIYPRPALAKALGSCRTTRELCSRVHRTLWMCRSPEADESEQEVKPRTRQPLGHEADRPRGHTLSSPSASSGEVTAPSASVSDLDASPNRRAPSCSLERAAPDLVYCVRGQGRRVENDIANGEGPYIPRFSKTHKDAARMRRAMAREHAEMTLRSLAISAQTSPWSHHHRS